jgi:hypothetical protein
MASSSAIFGELAVLDCVRAQRGNVGLDVSEHPFHCHLPERREILTESAQARVR